MTERIVLATGNAGKLREMQALLGDYDIVPQSRFIDQEVEETGLSFVENALLKARHASRASGLPAIADDSGLAVDALDGQPGIYSARYAGDDATDAQNIDKLLQALEAVEHRRARFHCVIVYLAHPEDPCPMICHGRWEGSIAHSRQGDGGFGYDPVFIPDDTGIAAALLAPEEKNRLSHRGKALSSLLSLLNPSLR